MVEYAQALGANALLEVPFMTSDVMQGASGVLVYGTAVKVQQG